MLSETSLDPYEEQLLTVFNTYDYDKAGSLDVNGLSELCQTLQLEKQTPQLIASLLGDRGQTRVKFIEFKDALLSLLARMQNSNEFDGKELQATIESPEREVSPKFVYGSKKYGRRSRPKIDGIISEETTGVGKNPKIIIQRSASDCNEENVNSKKRKPNLLKKCASLPDQEKVKFQAYNLVNSSDLLVGESEFICTEEMLREAWKTLGVGKDGYLNQNELILVCDAIGLHNLAGGVIRQLSDKITLDYNHRITFQELLEVLKHDETWCDVVNSTPSNIPKETLVTTQEIHNLFPDSRTFQYISLGPNGNGIINKDIIIDMWENVGITAPKELLHELGFSEKQINIIELATVLDSTLKGFQEPTGNIYNNPHLILLQANLALYQSEIRSLKNVFKQLNAEKHKLKSNIVEANNRASMLAQEVDDNHLKMEENTAKQVKLLEQRHSDILKGMRKQFSDEKEDLTNCNQKLKHRIMSLDLEITKLESDLAVAQNYLNGLEKENYNLTTQIDDLHQDKGVLREQLLVLETECQKYAELEHDQLKPLLTKLSSLEQENVQLRDQSDEMVSEIENLTSQMANIRSKLSTSPTDQSMEDHTSLINEGIGIGFERRIDYSPTKDTNPFNMANSTPMLGKFRILPRNQEDRLTSSESGFDTEVEWFDGSFSTPSNDNKEITRLQAKVMFLEQLLNEHSIPFPASQNIDSPQLFNNSTTYLEIRVKQLEAIINDIKYEASSIIISDCKNCDTYNKVIGKNIKDFEADPNPNNVEGHSVHRKSYSDAGTMTENDVDLRVEILEGKNKELIDKCSELENCIELLRNEYEKCEDYWAQKLDEERQIFEKEQNQNSEKLSDLIHKMNEYEEQFEDMNPRLPPIEETDNLEKQFTDLEQEFDDYKMNTQILIYNKDAEIEYLKLKLTELALQQKLYVDKEVQVDELSEYNIIANKMMQLSQHITESTNYSPADTEVLGSTSNVSTDQSLDSSFHWKPEDNVDTQLIEPAKEIFSNSLPATTTNSVEIEGQASSLNCLSGTSPLIAKNSTPYRSKRSRKHERDVHMYKKVDHQDRRNVQTEGECKDDKVIVPLSTIQNFNSRRQHLEQRCRHLQMVVKQQHQFAERTLQQCLQNQQGERAELQCRLRLTQEKIEHQVRSYRDLLDKLGRADLLVKELYVENSYLIASVQRLEQQCQILSHCSSNKSF